MSAMRAVRLVAPERFEPIEVARPEPGEGQVLVRVDGCGVCGSNLPPWLGQAGVDFPLPAGAPGHEAYGVVAGVGRGVRGFSEGDAVATLTYRSFAEYDVADASATVPLPPALEGEPVLGEPLACAVNVERRSRVREGDLVVVIGVGFLGALLVQLVRRERPAAVIAISRRQASRELARRLGADRTAPLDGVDGVSVEHWLTGAYGRLADVVIEATGYQEPLDLGARLTRERGTLVIAGYHQGGPRKIDLQLWNWRGIDVVNAHERDPELYARGMREGIERLAAGEVELGPLISHRYPLERIDRAFETAAGRGGAFVKALIEPGESS